MKQKTKKAIAQSGLILSFGFFNLLFVTFLCALLNPSKTIVIAVNIYGEVYLDLICFIFTFIVITYSLFFFFDKPKN